MATQEEIKVGDSMADKVGTKDHGGTKVTNGENKVKTIVKDKDPEPRPETKIRKSTHQKTAGHLQKSKFLKR